MKEENKVKNAEATKIARAILYIAAFLVLVRCDLWVSMVVLMGVGAYMVQAGLFVKMSGLLQKVLSAIAMIKQGMANRMMDESAQRADAEDEEKQEKPLIEPLIEPFGYENELDQVNPIPEPPEDFWGPEDHIDDIWNNDKA